MKVRELKIGDMVRRIDREHPFSTYIVCEIKENLVKLERPYPEKVYWADSIGYIMRTETLILFMNSNVEFAYIGKVV